MLKDTTVGLLGSNCLLLAEECSSKRLGLVICVSGGSFRVCIWYRSAHQAVLTL